MRRPGDDLRDRIELRELVEGYAFAVDQRDGERLASMFTDDGGIDLYLPDRPEPVGRLRGAKALGQLIAMLELYRATVHVVTNCVVTVDGDRATGSAYCIAHHLHEDESGVTRDETLVISYDDEFVRTAAGWRFALRSIHRRWSAQAPAGHGPIEIDRAVARQRRTA